MTSPRRIIVAGLVAVLGGASGVALSSCSDDDVLGNDDGKVNVSLTERDLDPGRVDVDDGKVEFEVKNDGERLHAFAVETSDGVKRISEIKPGDTENLIVNLPEGSYRMYDPRGSYRERGVRGEVIVRDNDSDTVRERTVERTVVDEEPLRASTCGGSTMARSSSPDCAWATRAFPSGTILKMMDSRRGGPSK